MIARRAGWAALVALPAGFLGVFFVYPVATVVARGLSSAGGATAADVFTNPALRQVAWFTLWQATASTAATLAVGLPAAWALARHEFPGRGVARALLLVPFVLPTVVVGTAITAFIERAGLDRGPLRIEHTVWAILLAHVVFNVAVIIRVVGGSWALLDPRPEEAARTLGAGRVRAFFEVTLPRLAPSMWAATSIVFLFSFTSFGVILVVGGPRLATLETEIWRFALQRTDFATAAALAVVQLLAVVSLVVVSTRAERTASGRARAQRPTPPRRPRGARHVALVAGILGGTALVVLSPLAMLIERSLRVGDGYGLAHYRGLATGDPRSALFVPPLEAIANSLVAAATAMALALSVGAVAAVVAVHGPPRLGHLTDVALMVPLGTSAVTVGFGILVALDAPPLDLRTSRLIVPIAQALIGIPFVVRTLVPALRGVDPRLRDAARVLGAPPRRVWREVDLAMVWRPLLIGAAFSFAIALGEFGATSFLVRPDAPTVPVAMFRLLGQPGAAVRGQAMALGVVLAGLTALCALIIERLRPRDALGW